MEPFEIDENELYANMTKKRRKFTKEDAIYGVFKGDSSEDEEDEYESYKTKKTLRTPLSFVSSGSVGGDTQSKTEDDDEEEESTTRPSFSMNSMKNEQSDDEEESSMSSLANRPGLGSSSKSKPKSTNPPSFVSSSSKTEDKTQTIPKNPPTNNNNNNNNPHLASSNKPSFSSTSNGTSKPALSSKPGKTFSSQSKNSLKAQPEFEKFTKGFGSKMLMKMGWSAGEGLGREGTGINRPIEVQLRPKGQGLGFGAPERTRQQVEDFPNEEDIKDLEKEREKKGKVGREPGWKRRTAKPKKVYKLPSELIEEQKQAASQKVTIIDMTGEKPRVLSSMEDAYENEGEKEENGGSADYMPELQHNLRLLVDLKEADILNIDKKKNSEVDSLNKLSAESTRLESIVANEATRIHRMKQIIKLIDECQVKIRNRSIDLKGLAHVFHTLMEKFPEEYAAESLHLLASALVLPMLKDELDDWNPLENPNFAVDQFKVWRDLIYKGDDVEKDVMEEEDDLYSRFGSRGKKQKEDTDVFTQLCCDIVLPKIRYALTNSWNVRDPSRCLLLIETWESILPRTVANNILNQLILPKLAYEVENWNPRADIVPIHVWLHPWLPSLGDDLSSLFPSIRHKLGIVLQQWNPLDPSAHVMLLPWKNVFSDVVMESLLNNSIVPKLGQALRALVINPSSQSLQYFDAVLLWQDLISVPQLAIMFDKEFFPKWHKVLHSWLSTSPNYDEISQWYLGWKQKFPPAFQSNDLIRSNFNHGLNIMNSALSGQPLPPTPAPTSASYATAPKNETAAKHKFQPKAKPPAHLSASAVEFQADEISFKDVIEKFAEEKGFVLMPSKKRYEGKQLYTLGKHTILLEKEMILKLDKGELKPIGLDELLQQ